MSTRRSSGHHRGGFDIHKTVQETTDAGLRRGFICVHRSELCIHVAHLLKSYIGDYSVTAGGIMNGVIRGTIFPTYSANAPSVTAGPIPLVLVLLAQPGHNRLWTGIGVMVRVVSQRYTHRSTATGRTSPRPQELLRCRLIARGC